MPAFLRRLGGYLFRHPVQARMLFGLMTGVVALIALPMFSVNSEDEYHGYS